MIICPYPLKMDAKGQLLPETRRWVYSGCEYPAEIVGFSEGLQPGDLVAKDQNLILMHSSQLEEKVRTLNTDIGTLKLRIDVLRQLLSRPGANQADTLSRQGEMRSKMSELKDKEAELRDLTDMHNLIPDRPGYFWVRSPINGCVLSADFRENLTNRSVKSSD